MFEKVNVPVLGIVENMAIHVCSNCGHAEHIFGEGGGARMAEQYGVPVLGTGTSDFPAFYCRKSGFGVDYAAKDESEIASIIKTKWDLGLEGGVLIGNPIPEEYALDYDEMEAVINKALAEADEKGVRGKDITPFLLARIKEITKGVSFASNVQLAYNNARVAAKIAKALCKLS